MTTITIGADPELFVKNTSGWISGHTFPCGTKEAPRLVESGSVQVDGLALEFNVRPSATKEEFLVNTARVIKDLRQIVLETDPTASLHPEPSVMFGVEYLRSLPPKTTELGCNVDYNGWTMKENPKPDAQVPFRTGSGHVHIGFVKDADPLSPAHFRLCADLTKELDYFLGLPSLMWDPDKRRRDLYGKAGAFRPKPYGMEYRVLSNAWLRDIKTMSVVYDQTMKCCERFFMSRKKPLSDRFGETARILIDDSVVDWADHYQKIAHEVLHA